MLNAHGVPSGTAMGPKPVDRSGMGNHPRDGEILMDNHNPYLASYVPDPEKYSKWAASGTKEWTQVKHMSMPQALAACDHELRAKGKALIVKGDSNRLKRDPDSVNQLRALGTKAVVLERCNVLDHLVRRPNGPQAPSPPAPPPPPPSGYPRGHALPSEPSLSSPRDPPPSPTLRHRCARAESFAPTTHAPSCCCARNLVPPSRHVRVSPTPPLSTPPHVARLCTRQVCTLRTYKDPAHTTFEGAPIGEVVGSGTAVPGGITKRGNTAQVKFLQLNGLPIKLHNMKVENHNSHELVLNMFRPDGVFVCTEDLFRFEQSDKREDLVTSIDAWSKVRERAKSVARSLSSRPSARERPLQPIASAHRASLSS